MSIFVEMLKSTEPQRRMREVMRNQKEAKRLLDHADHLDNCAIAAVGEATPEMRAAWLDDSHARNEPMRSNC